tara:strand:+ start:4092 stop:5033 length:942 start_codon:yes stop_codon:yes gene_type:complete
MELGLIVSSFIIAVTNLFVFQRVFFNNKIIDNINHRSSHKAIATRSGGIALATCIFFISSFFYIKQIEIFNFSILIPLNILLLVGCYDDIYEVDFKLKFIFQIIAAKILIDNGFIIENLHGMLGINELNRIVAQMLTMFIILAIINAINFIDGIDGLALSIVTFFIVLFELLYIDISGFYYLSIIIIISFLPMYYFNLRGKNKIFLGDSGSLFLGGLISVYVLHILSNEYLIKPQFDINKLFFVFSILSYPIIDIIRVVTIRIANKRSPFEADRNHIHHKLLEIFQSHKKVVLSIILFQIIVFCLIQLVINII